MGASEHKIDLRRDLKAIVAGLSSQERMKLSGMLADAIMGSELYIQSDTIFAYCALPMEIDLDSLIESAFSDGKRVCVPMIDWEHKSMAAAEIHNLDTDLVVDRYGIRAARDRCLLVESDDIDLMLIPGLGFDRGMNRLGRGAGFYDRMIAAFSQPRPSLVGVCFEAQIIAKVPTEAHDFPMDWVITENGFV